MRTVVVNQSNDRSSMRSTGGHPVPGTFRRNKNKPSKKGGSGGRKPSMKMRRRRAQERKKMAARNRAEDRRKTANTKRKVVKTPPRQPAVAEALKRVEVKRELRVPHKTVESMADELLAAL